MDNHILDVAKNDDNGGEVDHLIVTTNENDYKIIRKKQPKLKMSNFCFVKCLMNSFLRIALIISIFLLLMAIFYTLVIPFTFRYSISVQRGALFLNNIVKKIPPPQTLGLNCTRRLIITTIITKNETKTDADVVSDDQQQQDNVISLGINEYVCIIIRSLAYCTKQ